MTIATNDLKPNYLPLSFRNISPHNQSYVLTVRRPDPAGNKLEGLVHTEYASANLVLL